MPGIGVQAARPRGPSEHYAASPEGGVIVAHLAQVGIPETAQQPMSGRGRAPGTQFIPGARKPAGLLQQLYSVRNLARSFSL